MMVFFRTMLGKILIWQKKNLTLESDFKYFAKTPFKNRLHHRCFSVNIAKFLRTPILENIGVRLLLVTESNHSKQVIVQKTSLFYIF